MSKLMFTRYSHVEVRLGRSPRKFKPCILKINTPVMLLNDDKISDTTLYVQVLTPRGVGWVEPTDLCSVTSSP